MILMCHELRQCPLAMSANCSGQTQEADSYLISAFDLGTDLYCRVHAQNSGASLHMACQSVPWTLQLLNVCICTAVLKALS